jgi:lipid-A-disaccharide synthase
LIPSLVQPKEYIADRKAQAARRTAQRTDNSLATGSNVIIGMVAGESSGDILGAGLIKALRAHYPDCRFVGVGGPLMLAAGFESITPMERLSVMGFVEPLGRLPELLRLKRDLIKRFSVDRPAVFIGIDAPGFNLRLEQSLHNIHIPTVHYVSPSVWAWGKGRVKKIASAVDLMLTLFPFEIEVYRANKIPVVCVGHPMADRIDPLADQASVKALARARLGYDCASAALVCLMPGSRAGEVKRLAPVFLETAIRCLALRPAMRFVIPCATPALKQDISTLLSDPALVPPHYLDAFKLLDGDSQLAMQAADLLLMASGTATLEGMLLQRPMVVCYRMAPLTWWLASRLVKVPYVSLPNLLAGERLVPEFLQHAAESDELCRQVFSWLDYPERLRELSGRFTQIHQQLRLDADTQAALAISHLIEAEG